MAPAQLDRLAPDRYRDPPCTFVLSSTESVSVRCRAEWMTSDEACVEVPYGTARSVRQCWNAVAIIPDQEMPARSRELRMRAELVSAESLLGSESETERLLLRLTTVSDQLLTELAEALPAG